MGKKGNDSFKKELFHLENKVLVEECKDEYTYAFCFVSLGRIWACGGWGGGARSKCIVKIGEGSGSVGTESSEK